jgi:Uma2 family endonuclease
MGWLGWCSKAFGPEFVNAEAPIDVNPHENAWNEPVPDLIVLKRHFSTFDSNPQPEDLQLVVEISDSSLPFDLGVKAGLYARAGIAEYWVMDVAGRQLFAHRSPVDGAYTPVAVYGESEAIVPLGAPGAQFRPADAFRG